MLFPLHQTGTYFILQDIIFLSALVKKGVGGGAGAIESLIWLAPIHKLSGALGVRFLEKWKIATRADQKK